MLVCWATVSRCAQLVVVCLYLASERGHLALVVVGSLASQIFVDQASGTFRRMEGLVLYRLVGQSVGSPPRINVIL